MRISKVTTKTGDRGSTGLGDGERVSKADLRIQAIGDIDELNAVIGWAKTACSDEKWSADLSEIQNDLLNLGGELAMPGSELNLVTNDRIISIESALEELNSDLPPLKDFIVPEGDEFTVRVHIARAVCRRTERSVVAFMEHAEGQDTWIVYLNRLSDYFFVLARASNQRVGKEEQLWQK